MRTLLFSGQFTAQLPAANNKKRLRQFREFIGRDLDGVHALDIGSSNFISRELKIAHNTHGDLNRGVKSPSNEYEIITNFEVLQHCCNHLMQLEECYRLLKTGGKMYLATPRQRWLAYYHGRANFVEFKPDRLKILLEYVGFTVTREKVYNPWPFKFVFYGFLQPFRWLIAKKRGIEPTPPGAPKFKWTSFGMRPVMKWLFHRYIIMECRK